MAFMFQPAFTRLAAAAFATVALAGCATFATTPEAAVRARAQRNWNARIAGELDKTYAFTTPSYRGATSLDKYKKGFGSAVQLTSAEVADVKCESADKCVANTKVVAKPLLMLGRRNLPPIVTYIDETWLNENGQWWLFPTP